jgi:hypothetical protein
MEVDRFDMDGDVELTMIHVYIDVQKCDFRGGDVPGELDGISTVEAFKELGEGFGTMRPEEENIIDKTQPEAGFLDSGVKEILFKESHEQVGIGRGHTGAHGGFLNLEVMSGVKGEMVVGEDKLGKLVKELSGWQGVGRAFIEEVLLGRVTMGVKDIGVEGSDINSRHDGVGKKRHGERSNDIKEMVSVFYVGGEGFDPL